MRGQKNGSLEPYGYRGVIGKSGKFRRMEPRLSVKYAAKDPHG